MSSPPVSLITGGSRGIGRGIAMALARLGHDLVLNYASNDAAARDAAEECTAAASTAGRSVRIELCQADISRDADRRRLIDAARSAFGRLDLLVNNAGVAPEVRSDLLDTSEESFDRVMAINLKGPFFLTQLAARWMIETTRTNPPDTFRPKIVTLTSISAYTASTQRGEYCISKAGLSMLTPLFASRLAEHGIQVYEIRPGLIQSDMTAAVQAQYTRLIDEGLTPIRRWGTPEEVGKAVAAIAQDAFPFSTGEVFNVDGGFHLRRL